MIAVIKIGGRQYKVQEGSKIVTMRMPDKVGATMELLDLLGKAKVKAKILEHFLGPKVRIFKFRPKTRYKRTTSHRQPLTKLEIVSIK